MQVRGSCYKFGSQVWVFWIGVEVELTDEQARLPHSKAEMTGGSLPRELKA